MTGETVESDETMSGMSQGWDAGVPEPERNAGNPLFSGPRIFKVSHKQNENTKKTCLIDDNPIVGYRHKINTYPLGRGVDFRAKDIRMTCASPSAKEPDPRSCVLCEAMLRNGDIIKRIFTANLTIIDETGYYSKKNNRQVTFLKNLLELDYPYYKVFQEQKKVAPNGTIAGMRFNVMRPTGDPQRTKTFGDAWTPLGMVNPFQHYWNCPAIPHMIEAAKGRGSQISWEDAVKALVSPLNYREDVDNYDPQKAEAILMFALAKDYTASSQQGPGGPGGGYGGAQAMAAGSVPNYSTAPPMPGQQMQAPQGPPPGYQMYVPPAPPQGGFQAQAQGGFPQQAPPQAPPQVASPQGAAPMQAPQAPPMPQQAAPVQQQQQQQQVPQQPIDGYQFDQQQGWSNSFPGQGQQPAFAAPQQGQPQQAPMQAPPMPPQQAPQQAPPQQQQQAPQQAAGMVLPNVPPPF
jgi:hypothetical protein